MELHSIGRLLALALGWEVNEGAKRTSLLRYGNTDARKIFIV